ncbi:AraC family transcriptional regulator [Paenibacillus alginolyticus]|uniref:AraC family transcriptional regulator n=1 Tax=Paenibacillus alginolyticus TaxID=59839 RepID=A0ABT4GBY8_9BACL|nr:AraC family transcriptional regulator [Paenibacillus alginolyticus]MCY9693657.1 AraC family transcriptional regulator [Paenibacillus alginolyticus]MEC0145614.1 AraC family transcriptional regulator [Paenibacillus alginolyticus]
MKLSTIVDVRKEPFHLNHYKSSRKQVWEIYHAHPCMEFLFVYEGQGSVEVNKHQLRIESGTLLMFQPFQLHRIRIEGPFVRSVLMFDPYKLDAALLAFSGVRKWFNILWKQQLTCQVLPQQHNFAKIFEDLNRKLRSVPANKQQEEFILCLLSILQQLEPFEKEVYNGQKDKNKPRYNHTALQMIEWIELHYKERFDLNRMSEDLHLSTYYLSHTFRQSTGSSITEFIISRRLKEACLLLETTSETAGFIAQEVGFLNGSYFCRVFKTVLGITPKAYRMQV